MSDREYTCALWYFRYHVLDYWLCRDEEEAASLGVSMSDNGEASIAGVQFSDGRYVARSDWVAFRVEEDRRSAAWERERAEEAARPPRPTRKIVAPFLVQGTYGGARLPRELTIDADEPDWLGGLPEEVETP